VPRSTAQALNDAQQRRGSSEKLLAVGSGAET